MQTHEIRYFLATARELNFTRAATACGVSQPALTRAIQKLEKELGGRLFHRRPGQIVLTALGAELFPQLEQIEVGLQDIRRQARRVVEASASMLRLGVMCTVSPTNVVEILARLKLADESSEVSIRDAQASQVIDMLLDGQIDVGITAQPSLPEATSHFTVLEERYVVALPHDDPWPADRPMTLREVAAARYLERLGCEFDDYLELLPETADIDFNVVFSSEREDWIQALIRAGEGYAIVPQGMGCLPGIRTCPLIEPVVAREISIVSVRGQPVNEVARSFLRLARAHHWHSRRDVQ